MKGFVENDFTTIAEFFNQAVWIAIELKNMEQGKKLKGFHYMCTIGLNVHPNLVQLKPNVQIFASSFPTIGFDESEMVYNAQYDFDADIAA